MLDDSLEYQETLGNVVRLVVPNLADYAVIVLRTSAGALDWESAVHRDPMKQSLVERLHRYVPDGDANTHPAANVSRRGVTQLIKAIDDDYLRSVARDGAHLTVLRELAPTSYIVVPLTARDTTLGSMVLATTRESGRRYTHRDVVIANEIGRRIASAVDRALLYLAATEAGRARERMVSVVSHDLKNPISTIQMAVTALLEVMRADDEAYADVRRHLQVIQRAGKSMYRLIHDLLDVAAFEAGQLHMALSPVPVRDLMYDAVELLRPLAEGKGVRLIADIPTELPMVAADRARVTQVFSNIGGNAIKFTPEGGSVVLRAVGHDSAVEFSVSDSGPGISPNDIPHIFDRYWQAAKTLHLGSGLGLTIAKGIVEGHGGVIRAESRLGRGCCVSFSLVVSTIESGFPATSGVRASQGS